jgi:hypothetical protein
MHILFLSDNFPPEVNAPASRTFEHCREWVRAGHTVTVITTAPNFPKGRLFEGYRNCLWQTEMMDGIRVIRVWTYITANAGFLRRILDYQSFMVAAALAAPFVRRVDVIVGTSPQFFTVCAAWVISVYKWIPFIFELRDIWPESIKAVGAMQDSWWLRRLEALELFLYRRAARIVTVTQSFRANLERRGIDVSKIQVVTNGIDLARYKPLSKKNVLRVKLGLQGKFVAGYIGTQGMAHALETLLEAAAVLKNRTDGKDIVILLLGDGSRKQELQEQARAMKLGNVLFLDSVPKDEVVEYWALLDVSIIHLRKTELFISVIPSKLFECMGMGIPVLHGVAGESADIVRKTGCGETFEPENVDELVQLLVKMKQNPDLLQKYSQSGLASAQSYGRKNLALKMLGIIADAVRQ